MRTFKEGDKLLCCKKFDHLKIGKYYEIILCGSHLPYCFNISGFWFSLNKTSSVYPYVYEYFFTEKEERKLKLQILKLKSI